MLALLMLVAAGTGVKHEAAPSEAAAQAPDADVRALRSGSVSLALTPGIVGPGQPVLLRGHGFRAKRRVLVTINGQPALRSLTSRRGSLGTGFIAPGNPGAYSIGLYVGARRVFGTLRVVPGQPPSSTALFSSSGAEVSVSRTIGFPGTRLRVRAQGLPGGPVQVRLGGRLVAGGRSAGGRYGRILRVPSGPIGRRELALYAGRLELLSHFDVLSPARFRPGAVTLAAAGDIACQPGSRRTAVRCRDEATARVVGRLNPRVVVPLGDFQDHFGRIEAAASGFDATWGPFKTRMRPTPGNHEFLTFAARGYFTYFGPAAAPPGGYYSYDLGSWHVVVLNSNCPRFISCAPGSPQEQWLRADLAAHPAQCTLAYFHHPRFTSAGRFYTPALFPLWRALYDYGADVILNGHAHIYERFAPQNPYGGHDPGRGIRQFIVGTGGSTVGRSIRTAPWSEVRRRSFGVLGLRLLPGSYRWRFHPIAGHRGRDAGADSCH